MPSRVRALTSADESHWLRMRLALWAVGFEEVERIVIFRRTL